MTIQELHINEIIKACCKDNDDLCKIIRDLDNDERIAVCAILVAGRVDIDKLPKIEDNGIAKNIRITYFNQVKNRVHIEFTSLYKREYKNGAYVEIERDEPVIKRTYVSFEEYMRYANGEKPFEEY